MNDIGTRSRELTEAWALRTTDPDWAAGAVIRFRDLLLMRNAGLITVIACDSNAGIGDQPADVIRQPARLTGFGAAKVPLMEVLAAGATPVVLVNNLGCSLDGPGREILAGIEDCVRLSGFRPVITGSDETNVRTTQTSVGITVVGVAAAENLLLGRARAGDVVVAVGRPMDGLTVPYAETDPDVVTPREVAAIVARGIAHEVLPVGSRGIAYEAGELARTAGLDFAARVTDLDVAGSAGSSTCVLVACEPDRVARLSGIVAQPVTVVGDLARPARIAD
jgi:hypothetical protein